MSGKKKSSHSWGVKMTGRTSKNKNDEQVLPDSDEHFAFIAGYTAGGFPYGVTWEEHEEIEARAAIPQPENLPVQGSPVSLDDLAREMHMIFDTMTVYFKRSTGEFIAVTDEFIRAAEEESLDDRPAWEQEAIRMTAEVLAREDEGDYVPLPSKYEIHEYSIMERFCYTVKDSKTANDLLHSISGKGAFRRFKDAIHRHSVEEAWYRFKDEAYKEIAREWCRENFITWYE